MRAGPIVSTNRWVLYVAILLIVPGTLASVAFGGVGLLMLLLLGVDWVFARATGATSTSEPRPIARQLLLAASLGGVIGATIGLVAWIT